MIQDCWFFNMEDVSDVNSGNFTEAELLQIQD